MKEVKTGDVYEASWYVLMGGTLTEIAFGKIQPSRTHKLGYTTAYKLTIVNVEPRFIKYWRESRPIGNIRQFSQIRIKIKRKIRNAEKQNSKMS